MNNLNNYFHFIQDASEETIILFQVLFITLSILTLFVQFFCVILEKMKRKNQPLTDLYHFTSDDSWKKIRDQKKITAGKNGYIFTTSNANIRKFGSGKSRSKTPPTVIIRDKALALFSSNQGISPTGNKFYGAIFF